MQQSFYCPVETLEFAHFYSVFMQRYKNIVVFWLGWADFLFGNWFLPIFGTILTFYPDTKSKQKNQGCTKKAKKSVKKAKTPETWSLSFQITLQKQVYLVAKCYISTFLLLKQPVFLNVFLTDFLNAFFMRPILRTQPLIADSGFVSGLCLAYCRVGRRCRRFVRFRGQAGSCLHHNNNCVSSCLYFSFA